MQSERNRTTRKKDKKSHFPQIDLSLRAFVDNSQNIPQDEKGFRFTDAEMDGQRKYFFLLQKNSLGGGTGRSVKPVINLTELEHQRAASTHAFLEISLFFPLL